MQSCNQLKSKNNKNMIVQFGNLNSDNKTEFLEFLLRNNITFQKGGGKGKDDYVAKVTITKNNKQNKQNSSISPNKKNTRNLNKSLTNQKPTHSKNQLSCISSNLDKSIKLLTPKKSNNILISQDKGQQNQLKSNKSDKKCVLSNSKLKQKNNKLNKQNSYKIHINQKRTSSKQVRTTQFLPQQSIQYKNDEKIKNKIVPYKVQPANYNKNNISHVEFGNGKTITKQLSELKSKSIDNNKLQKQTNGMLSKKGKPKKELAGQKEKIIQINNQLKKKTFEQKQINDLVNKYLKLFDLKLSGQRPIKWSLSQLMKIIQQLYHQLFQKNNQALAHKSYSKKQMHNSQTSNFVKYIKQFFIHKFKSQKLACSNLINMLYSLSFYLENQKKVLSGKTYAKQVKANLLMTASGIFMQAFEDFLCQIYSFEDLLFFLFVRSIIMNQLNTFNSAKLKVQKQSCRQTNTLQKQIVLNFKDIIKILKLILGEDMDLVQQYKIMILSHINLCFKTQNGEKQEGLENDRCLKISGPQFLTLLVQDYKTKRILMQDSQTGSQQLKILKNKSIQNYSLTSENTFEQLFNGYQRKKNNLINSNVKQQKLNMFGNKNINQNDTNELTFGEQTQQNMQKFLSNQRSFNQYFSFWENCEDNKQIGHFYQSNSIESIIFEKMNKKVYQFFNILIQNRSQYNSVDYGIRKHHQLSEQYKSIQSLNIQKKIIIELLMKKSMNLLSCVIEMNKIRWFEELKVTDPSQEDIEKVQELQLAYRRLKQNPDAEIIGKMCKSILTVHQLTFALQKLLCI